MIRRNFTKPQKELIRNRDEYHCVYCGQPAHGIDHVIPVNEGGLTITANGVCCCPKCNMSKHTSLAEKWIVKGLARLIQHGEDVSWVGAIREAEEPNILAYAAELLLDAGATHDETAYILNLSVNELKEIVEL